MVPRPLASTAVARAMLNPIFVYVCMTVVFAPLGASVVPSPKSQAMVIGAVPVTVQVKVTEVLTGVRLGVAVGPAVKTGAVAPCALQAKVSANSPAQRCRPNPVVQIIIGSAFVNLSCGAEDAATRPLIMATHE